MCDYYSFSSFNSHCSNGISQSLENIVCKDNSPIFICIGSDLVLGDSLGPLVGTFLKVKKIPFYIYGTLSYPITAKEINKAGEYLRKTHPNSTIIAIDAAVGEQEDIGLIRVVNKGLKPGLGVNKKLEEIGDVSIIGVVAEKSTENFSLFNLTRLNLIYTMAENIANGIDNYIKNTQLCAKTHQNTFSA